SHAGPGGLGWAGLGWAGLGWAGAGRCWGAAVLGRGRSAGAVAARGEDLPWVHEALGIEGGLEALLQPEEGRPLFEGEVGRLGEADAVLAAERAAERDRGPEETFDGAVDARLLL